jgi:hypothetical protein
LVEGRIKKRSRKTTRSPTKTMMRTPTTVFYRKVISK